MKTKKPKAQKPKFSKQQVELAHKIVNDIAEGIDNKESPAQLRMALACYADALMTKHIEWAALSHRRTMMRIGWDMLERGLRDD